MSRSWTKSLKNIKLFFNSDYRVNKRIRKLATKFFELKSQYEYNIAKHNKIESDFRLGFYKTHSWSTELSAKKDSQKALSLAQSQKVNADAIGKEICFLNKHIKDEDNIFFIYDPKTISLSTKEII